MARSGILLWITSLCLVGWSHAEDNVGVPSVRIEEIAGSSLIFEQLQEINFIYNHWRAGVVIDLTPGKSNYTWILNKISQIREKYGVNETLEYTQLENRLKVEIENFEKKKEKYDRTMQTLTLDEFGYYKMDANIFEFENTEVQIDITRKVLTIKGTFAKVKKSFNKVAELLETLEAEKILLLGKMNFWTYILPFLFLSLDLYKPPLLNVTQTYAQLLQLNDYSRTQVTRCSVKITRTITHCGMHHHASRVFGGELSYFKDLTREECIRIQQTGYFSIGTTQLVDIHRNSTLHQSVVFAGISTMQGQCETAGVYTDAYGQWTDVYVAGWIEIQIDDYSAVVNLESNRVMLRSGITCILSDLTCIDADGAHVFWDAIPEDMCGINKYSLLYEGNMDKVVEDKTDKIMYSLETKDITFAFFKKGEQNVCGYRLTRTEHPRLFILESNRTPLIKSTAIAAENLDIFAYMNSKFLFIEKHIKGEITRMYFDIMQQKCELERKVLQNALSIATISPAEAGYKIMEQPGYLGVVTGEVIHLIKCVRVEVKRRKVSECYEQLPVSRGNENYFLTPRTHILVRTGNEIPCDQRLPAMYKIGSTWIRMLPDAVDARPPEVLKPQTKPTWQYHNAETLALGGIYGEKETRRLRDMILFPMERPSVLNRVALGVSGRKINNEGISIMSFFDQKTLDAIAQSTFTKLWTGFLSFGTASAGIIGLLMLGRLIKLVVDTIVHGYAIYSLYGFSIHLIGAIWNSITQLLLHLGHKKMNDKQKSSDKSIDVEKNDIKETEKAKTILQETEYAEVKNENHSRPIKPPRGIPSRRN